MSKQNGGIIGPDNVTTGGFNGVASGVFKLGEVTKLIRESKWPEPSPFTNTVPNSVRLDGSADYFNRTMNGTEVTNSEKKVTYSGWIKKSEISSDGMLIEGWYNSSNYTQFYYQSTGALTINQAATASGSTYQINTNRLLRDPSAWYHIMLVIDTTQGTASNRVKLYINGVQETSFASAAYPNQNSSHQLNRNGNVTFIGRRNSGDVGLYVNGYMANIECTDAQALTPSYFGSTNSDSGIWTPVPADTISSYGNNGLKLAFANAGALGTDTSGEGNNFTANSITSIDQTTDSPSNNFATLNPLDNFYANATFSKGNTQIVTGSGREASSSSTIYLTQGKWYWETKFLSSSAPFVGIQPIPSFGNSASAAVLQLHGLGLLKTGKVETTNGSGGSVVLASYATYTTNDIIGVALDLDANKIYFYKNGSILGASGVSVTAPASTRDGHYMVAVGAIAGQDTISVNFGNPSFAISSGNTDSSGFGNFEYAVPTGYLSICTNNLNLLG